MKFNRYPFAVSLSRLTAALTFVAAAPAIAADLKVEIAGIQEVKGNMMVAVYDSQQAFEKTATYRAISRRVEKSEMALVLADMPVGEYAIMVYQDLDRNEKLDTNMLGIPKEPWSGSLEGRSVFGPPGWSDVNFKVGEADTTIKIDLN